MDIEYAHAILKTARALIEKHKPYASLQKKAAFANAVQELVCGVAGGYGGPSVREHAAVHIFGPSKPLSFNSAVDLLADEQGPIFGPITDIHVWCYLNEECFDNDPKDLEILRARTI
ncbi:MAG: hypothetical protein CL685_00100 [Candidatus Magasanikbacteria bacterium]|nr:hypothetical protein [Candidatus Magasanikbacteria bacterium]|tara:strand:+ start:111 stop:461 length:351 start_codon:yes stop_codon:yes gene_type:complete